ncbi:MAG TPA: CusA/CzcA family heavy metal efflux RND transporter [Drouetiella sp.]
MEEFFARLTRFRVAVCLIFGAFFAAGIYALMNLPIDAFPDLANNQVQILTEAPAMGVLEVEQQVTIPIESVMNGLPNIVQIRSMSKYGLSVVTVVFKDNVDTYFARQIVFERLQTAKARIPQDCIAQLGPISTAMGEIFQYTVSGANKSLTDLKTLHDWDIKYQLRTVPGVAEVNTWGGFTDEYIVTIEPTRLQQYGLTMQDVFSAIRLNNQNFGAGIIDHEKEQFVVRGIGRVNNIENIENIIVKRTQGVPVLLRNVATIGHGAALRQGASTKDGEGEAVVGLVMMLKGENSRAVIERVKDKILEIQKTLPEGISLRPFYDQSGLVEQTIDTVRSNLLEGGFLVVAVLLLMVGNFRAAAIVALAIPLSMTFSFIGMRTLGVTANIMSLGAVDFGMIVDGSIVMVENIMRNMSHAGNASKNEVIQLSVRQVCRPILFGILIIAVVYLPVLCLEGMEYKMFAPMVITVCSALLGSLLISLILVPVLCSLLLPNKLVERESIILKLVTPPYMMVFNQVLKHRILTIFIACACLVAALGSVPFLGTEFVPKLDEGDFLIEVKNVPSISLQGAIEVSTHVEALIKQFPEVKTVVSRTGRPDLATDPMGVYASDVFVTLKPRNEWKTGVTKTELIEKVRKELENQIAGAQFNFTQPIAMRVDELVSGVRADVAVKIFGEDMDYLQSVAQSVQGIVGTVPGVTDLQIERVSGSAQILIVPDRNKLARYGINVDEIRQIAETAIIGTPVSEVLQGRRRFDLRVKLPKGSNLEPANVGDLLIEASNGQRIPLSQVAEVRMEQGMELVNREFGQRRIVVQCNVRGRDVGSFVAECQKKLDKEVKLKPGYYMTWGGQFENQERAMKRLSYVVPISILIIFVLLTATFGSIKEASIVLLNVPFALIGGICALWVRGMYLSVPATIGFVALFGVAVLNGLVLISAVNRLIADGLDVEAALHAGVESRLRPVLMTAMVASLGFLPMAVSQGAGAEVQKPLATVVIGGLCSSTLLTLLVLPAVYALAFKRRARKVEDVQVEQASDL